MINTKSLSFCRKLLSLVTAATLAMIEAYAQTRKPVNHLQDKPGATHSGKEPQAGSNGELASELIEMEVKGVAAIEETRKAKNEADPKALEAAAQRWSEIKQRNTTRLKAIINRFGWPGRALVGDRATRAAFIVLQHSDHDLELRRKELGLPPMSDCLKLMKEARAKSRAQAPKRP